MAPSCKTGAILDTAAVSNNNKYQEGAFVSADDNFDQVYGLLRQVTILAVVSDFLESKGLPHSASSWDSTAEKRLLPAIEAQALSIEELVDLLAGVEESGRQHVFLYSMSAKSARTVIDQERVLGVMRAQGLEALIGHRRVLDKPDKPTFVDVRWEQGIGGLALVIKLVKKRFSRQKISSEKAGTIETVRYEHKEERAVSLLKVHSGGLVEVRIGSQSSSSQYRAELDEFWEMVGPFLSEDQVNLVSLGVAKSRMWDERAQLADVLAFTSSTLTNDQGTALTATSRRKDGNLSCDEGASFSLNGFKERKGYCESSNVWFLPKDGGPIRNLHVLLGGELHEFAITVHCHKHEYDYVLAKIREFNRKVPGRS